MNDPTSRTRSRIPNRATRWSAIVYFLVLLAGGVGLTGAQSTGKAVLAGLSMVLMATLALRALRAGVTTSDGILTSRSEILTRRLRWDQIERIETRGQLLQNRVGATLKSGRWIALQFHPYGAEFARAIEESRPDSSRDA